MNKQRLAILITAVIGAIATFLPWVNMPIVGSINGTKGDGWITFILFLIPIIITLIGNRNSSLKGGLLLISIIPAFISAIVGIGKIIDFNSKVSEIGDNPFAKMLGDSVSIGFGLYLVIIAGLALPLLAFTLKVNKNNNF